MHLAAPIYNHQSGTSSSFNNFALVHPRPILVTPQIIDMAIQMVKVIYYMQSCQMYPFV